MTSRDTEIERIAKPLFDFPEPLDGDLSSDDIWTLAAALYDAGLRSTSQFDKQPASEPSLDVEQGWAFHGYPLVLYQEPEDGSWSVLAPDLPGFVAAEMTIGGALRMAEDAMAAWLEAWREHRREIPVPSDPHNWRFWRTRRSQPADNEAAE
jgi:predicted RNase H-like HicB family nuclease